MIGEDRDGVRSSLQVLLPLNKGENNSKEFAIIDVIVSFGRREGLGKVSAGMKVSGYIRLHQDGTCGQEGGVGHESEGAGDVGDA